MDLIESAVARPYSGYYRSIYAKAAAPVESVCRNHGFNDGNKRTTVLLLYLFLTKSGYRLRPGDDLSNRVEDMVLAVASGMMDFAAIEAWLRANVELAD